MAVEFLFGVFHKKRNNFQAAAVGVKTMTLNVNPMSLQNVRLEVVEYMNRNFIGYKLKDPDVFYIIGEHTSPYFKMPAEIEFLARVSDERFPINCERIVVVMEEKDDEPKPDGDTHTATQVRALQQIDQKLDLILKNY